MREPCERVDVEPQHRVDAWPIGLGERARHALTSVVHQDVGHVAALIQRGNKGLECGGVSEIDRRHFRSDLARHTRGRRRELGAVARHHQNGSTFASRQPSRFKTNTFAGTGDQIFLRHRISPLD